MNDNPEKILIAAIGRNRELGKGPELIWRLSGDLKRFKELTTGSPIIMGRKTFESIGRPLPNRENIVVTRNSEYKKDGVIVSTSIEEAVKKAKETGTEKIFIIGGGEIYKQALLLADKLEITFVDKEDPEADVFFPEFEKDFVETSRETPMEENGITYQWVTYNKKPA